LHAVSVDAAVVAAVVPVSYPLALPPRYPVIGDVRGLGLMIGVEIVKPDDLIDPEMRDRLVVEGFKAGIVLLPCGDSTIQFCPPLVITKEEADTGLDRFEAALQKIVS